MQGGGNRLDSLEIDARERDSRFSHPHRKQEKKPTQGTKLARSQQKIISSAKDSLSESMLHVGGGGPNGMRTQVQHLVNITSKKGKQRSQLTICPQPSRGVGLAPIAGLAVALYDFVSIAKGELRFHKGDMLSVLDVPQNVTPEGWLFAKSSTGHTGLIPEAYVEMRARACLP